MQPDANVSSLSGPSSVVPSTIMQPDANVSSLSGPSDKERDTYSIPFFVSIALAAGLLIGLGIAMYLLVRFKKRARDVETNKEDTTKTLGSKCQIHPTDDVQT
ncbi:uncharacterized protein LOC127842836 [Dreissena polymorpha]|nr:uncharacterized protein LOC127842836 [Dreissena polymorpha]